MSKIERFLTKADKSYLLKFKRNGAVRQACIGS